VRREWAARWVRVLGSAPLCPIVEIPGRLTAGYVYPALFASNLEATNDADRQYGAGTYQRQNGIPETPVAPGPISPRCPRQAGYGSMLPDQQFRSQDGAMPAWFARNLHDDVLAKANPGKTGIRSPAKDAALGRCLPTCLVQGAAARMQMRGVDVCWQAAGCCPEIESGNPAARWTGKCRPMGRQCSLDGRCV